MPKDESETKLALSDGSPPPEGSVKMSLFEVCEHIAESDESGGQSGVEVFREVLFASLFNALLEHEQEFSARLMQRVNDRRGYAEWRRGLSHEITNTLGFIRVNVSGD